MYRASSLSISPSSRTRARARGKKTVLPYYSDYVFRVYARVASVFGSFFSHLNDVTDRRGNNGILDPRGYIEIRESCAAEITRNDRRLFHRRGFGLFSSAKTGSAIVEHVLRPARIRFARNVTGSALACGNASKERKTQSEV